MTHVEMEQFIAEYGADIYSFCCCLTGNRQEADDLYQETFLRAVEKQKHLDMAGNPKSYLLSTAVYLWKNHRRKAGWRKRIANTEYSGREDAEIGPKDSCDDLPEQKVIREEMQKTVRDAVLRLPDKMKVTVLLYYMEERTVEEIAEILRIPKGTVKSRMHQAREILRKELEYMLYE